MHLAEESELGFNLTGSQFLILKSARNEIGEYGVRQIA